MGGIRKERALLIVAWLSFLGLLFSGYLSYTEIFKKVCALGFGTCSNVAGIPACVYGFFMYLIVLIIAILGLKSEN